jgi:nicotinate phosphoribosyltransferase
MQQGVFKKFPDVEVSYKFKCRNYSKGMLLGYVDDIIEQAKHFCNLEFKPYELAYLNSLPYISEPYVRFLKDYKPDFNDVFISEKNGALDIHIEGTWLNTICLSTPLLSIISELVCTDMCPNTYEGSYRFAQKINFLKSLREERGKDYILWYIDFCTRRRYSRSFHEYIVWRQLKEVPYYFRGTSNVDLAMRYNTTPIGTQAHEWISAMQGLVKLEESQRYAFQVWADVYRGDLGIALSDTLGMSKFLLDFDMYFAKLFDGARQDSGDPYTWGDQLINHYKKMDIDPLTKIGVWSDKLNLNLMVGLNDYFYDKIMRLFGIGGFWGNDMGFVQPSIVIKMVKCNGRPVAKISDSPGKTMCENKLYLEYLTNVIKQSRR